jgi:rhomboid protease GluP
MFESIKKTLISNLNKKYLFNIIELKEFEKDIYPWGVYYNHDGTNELVIFINSIESTNEYLLSSLKILMQDKLYNGTLNIVSVLIDEVPQNTDLEIKFDNIIIIDPVNHKIISDNKDNDELIEKLKNTIQLPNEHKRDSFKPTLTYFLISINVLIFIITAYLSGDIMNSNINVLINLGAKDNALIMQGQYYRLITCMFLHGGLVHLALNMYSLYCIGPFVEKVYGKVKYVIVYFISGILCSFFSFMFSPAVSIGASGAIFGLLGAVLVFALIMKKNINKGFIVNILSVIGINLFLGFTLSNVDNYGHLGGLLGGLIVCSIMVLFKKEKQFNF